MRRGLSVAASFRPISGERPSSGNGGNLLLIPNRNNLHVAVNNAAEALTGDDTAEVDTGVGSQESMPWITVSQVVAVEQLIVASGVNQLGPTTSKRCDDTNCQTCRLLANEPSFVSTVISCPIPDCAFHKQFFNMLSTTEFYQLRNHMIMAHSTHQMWELNGISNVVLYKYFRITCCKKPGCGVLSKSRINAQIPRNGGSDEATYDKIPTAHACNRGPVLTNGPRAVDRGVGGPLLVPHVNMVGGDVGRPNAAMEPWLADALIGIQGIIGIQQLDAPPPMLQRIPVGQNTVIQGLSKIFRAINAALEIPGLSIVDRANLYKVVA